MISKYSVYYTNGTSRVISIEKPAGAHPTSILAVGTAIIEAEKTGLIVKEIGYTSSSALKILPVIMNSNRWTKTQIVNELEIQGQIQMVKELKVNVRLK